MFGELVAGAVAVVVVGRGCSTHVGGASGVLGVVAVAVAVDEGTVDTEGNIDVDNVDVEVDTTTVEEVFENHLQIG